MLGSLILDTVTRAAFPTVLTFAIYLLFAGHNAPGGGFVGGLVAGAALVLRYAGRGRPGVRAVVPRWLRFEHLLGAGLLLSGATAIVPLLTDHAMLYQFHGKPEVFALGKVPLGTTLVFDTGVFLIVVGLALGALEMLGRAPGDMDVRDPSDDGPGPAPSARATGLTLTGVETAERPTGGSS